MRGRRSLGREKIDSVCRVSEATSNRPGVYTGPRQRGADRSPHLVVITHQGQSVPNVLSRSGAETSKDIPRASGLVVARRTDTRGQRSSLERSRDAGAEDISEPNIPTRTTDRNTLPPNTPRTTNLRLSLVKDRKTHAKTLRET